MATQDLYEQWESRTRAEGRQEGRQEGRKEVIMASLGITYQNRFGTMPEPVRQALAEKVTLENLAEWLGLVQSAASAEDIARRVLNGNGKR
ncbi:MAG: hypothetical protein R3F14_09635 [Polyangiaceae bacterium]